MKVKDWIITYLIMLVPVVNIVFLFIWAFSEGNHNPNKVSWAKASLLWSAIILVLYFILFLWYWAQVYFRYRISNLAPIRLVFDKDFPNPIKFLGST